MIGLPGKPSQGSNLGTRMTGLAGTPDDLLSPYTTTEPVAKAGGPRPGTGATRKPQKHCQAWKEVARLRFSHDSPRRRLGAAHSPGFHAFSPQFNHYSLVFSDSYVAVCYEQPLMAEI